MYVSTSSAPTRGLGQASLANAALSSGISAGVGLATGAVSIWLNQIQLAHDADTATTQIVNGLAPLLQANVNAYLAGPGTCADQAAALSAYLTAVDWLMSPAGCGNGSYGSAGNRCISNRFGPGGATDATNPNNVQPFYPWASYYYYPILNDPRASGCAAQLAADNPNAQQEAAIQNILNAVSGNPQQTTAGAYDSSGSSSATTAAGWATSTSGTPATTASSFPSWIWLVAAGLAVFFIVE
jgi:hypothetical protein